MPSVLLGDSEVMLARTGRPSDAPRLFASSTTEVRRRWTARDSKTAFKAAPLKNEPTGRSVFIVACRSVRDKTPIAPLTPNRRSRYTRRTTEETGYEQD